MKILYILAFNLVSLACVLTAGVLADDGRPGWGWFLLVGLLTAVSRIRDRLYNEDPNRQTHEERRHRDHPEGSESAW